MDITARCVLMVGGTSGIGLELARRFHAAGSTVVVGGRSTDLLTQLAAEGLGTVEIDVTDPDSVSRACQEVLQAHPDLDPDGCGVEDPSVVTAEEVVEELLLRC